MNKGNDLVITSIFIKDKEYKVENGFVICHY